jgi:two-component system chemotaxis response regulator CheY
MNPAIQSQSRFALVVDDDELTQELLREMLADLGFNQVQSALDGRQALKRLATQQHPLQLLVCDIFMPEMDGFEFLEKLAALKFAGGVVLMTGGDPEMLRIARDIAVSNQLNVIGTFPKPVASEQMASVIATLTT